MIENSHGSKANVTVVKSSSLKESLLGGIGNLGGLQKYITNGDKIFLKINLRAPYGFPVNSNMELVKILVKECHQVGADEIYIGSYPHLETQSLTIARLLGIRNLFDEFGGKLIFLDDTTTKLRTIKVNNNIIKVPVILFECDKFFSVNQVNVEPLFKLTLSLLNSYSLIDNKYQKVPSTSKKGTEYLSLDQYKKDLISNVLSVYNLRKPDLAINDLFYTMEGAGPYLYKDSNLSMTGIIIMGDDSVAVDLTTFNLFNLDTLSSELLVKAQKKYFGESESNQINLINELPKDFYQNITLCETNLERIRLQNTSIKTGCYCSGCYEQAYHLLNLMQTIMTKDLKYIIKQSFLVGDKPPEPDFPENIILFGDCAISSTMLNSFHKISVHKTKTSIKENVKQFLKKNYVPHTQNTMIKKKNKRILKLSGCPPNLSDCLNLIINYYKKKQVPNLFLYKTLLDTFVQERVEGNINEGGSP